MARRSSEEELSLFGQCVEELCRILGISESEVARRVDISKATLSAYKRERRPAPDTVIRIWHVFRECMVKQNRLDLLENKVAFYGAGHTPTEDQEIVIRERIKKLKEE